MCAASRTLTRSPGCASGPGFGINATGEIEHELAVADGGDRISMITKAQPCIFKHRGNIKERQLEAVQEANMKRLALECSECKKEEWQNEIEAEITQVRLSPFSTPRCFWLFDRHGPKKDRDKMIEVLVSRHGAYIIRAGMPAIRICRCSSNPAGHGLL